jgi:hypothetical protein
MPDCSKIYRSAEADARKVPSIRGIIFLLLLASVAARAAEPPSAAAGAAAASAALPTFTPGLWEYRRTVTSAGSVKPQESIVKKCADPTADIQAKMADLKKKGCQFTPARRNKDRYVSSWNCPTPSGAMRFRDELTAKDSTSYQDSSETRSAQGVKQQTITAMRLGACPGGAVGAPAAPPQADAASTAHH